MNGQLKLPNDPVKNRKQMVEYFNETMASIWNKLYEREQFEYEENLVKSFVMEYHGYEENKQETPLIESFKNLSYDFNETEDKTLLRFSNKDKNKPNFFVDLSDKRFIIIHTSNNSVECGRVISNLTSFSPWIDNAWLDSFFMENLTYLGEFESWSSRFDNESIYTKNLLKSKTVKWKKVNLQIKTRPEVLRDDLKEIRKYPVFFGSLPLTLVRIKNKVDNTKLFSRSDISFDGQITARGNNFNIHESLVSSILKNYKKLILNIEEKFSLGLVEKAGKKYFKGNPINISIPKNALIPFKQTIESWFTGVRPFLLWGLLNYVRDDYAVVRATDLHVGEKINLEIAPDFIRIYLPMNTCGNTIVRILSNLQQHFHSGIEVINSEYVKFIRD